MGNRLVAPGAPLPHTNLQIVQGTPDPVMKETENMKEWIERCIWKDYIGLYFLTDHFWSVFSVFLHFVVFVVVVSFVF